MCSGTHSLSRTDIWETPVYLYLMWCLDVSFGRDMRCVVQLCLLDWWRHLEGLHTNLFDELQCKYRIDAYSFITHIEWTIRLFEAHCSSTTLQSFHLNERN